MSELDNKLTSLMIAGYQIDILEDTNIFANESRIGEYSPFEQTIRIAKGITKQQKVETLIHEVLEAVNDIYELGLDHDQQLCKLSVIIHQIIVSNSKIINDWISYDYSEF